MSWFLNQRCQLPGSRQKNVAELNQRLDVRVIGKVPLEGCGVGQKRREEVLRRIEQKWHIMMYGASVPGSAPLAPRSTATPLNPGWRLSSSIDRGMCVSK